MALAEEAEAEAAEAEALAAAARARAQAIQLRREAQTRAAENNPVDEAADTQIAEADTTSAEKSAAAADPVAETESAAAAQTVTTADTEVTDTEDATEVRPSPESAEPKRRLPNLRRLRPVLSATGTVLAAAALTLSLLGASTYMVWRHHQALERRQHDAAFIAAARQGIVNMTSFNFTRAKEDVQRVIDSSTGEFRDDFQKRAADFTTVVQQAKVVTEGSVSSAAVESMQADSAVVLVLASERVTNAAGAKDEPREFRLRVTVSRDGDQLKMSKVEFVL